jgi:hypothetical protein
VPGAVSAPSLERLSSGSLHTVLASEKLPLFSTLPNQESKNVT